MQLEKGECLTPAIRAMSDEKIWERYFSDFVHQQVGLQLDPSISEMSTKVLKLYFERTIPLSQLPPVDRLVQLHIAACVYIDCTKLSSVLRSLDNITDAVKLSPQYGSDTTSNTQSLLRDLRETGQINGPFAVYVISQLFNSMVGEVISDSGENQEEKSCRLRRWYSTCYEAV